MRNWTISRRLVVGFGLVVITVVALGAYGVAELRVIQAASNRVVHDSLPGTAKSGEVLALVQTNLASTLEHLQATEAAEMQEIEARIAANRERTSTLLDEYEGTITLPEDRALFDRIAPVRERYVAALQDAMALSRANEKTEAFALYGSVVKPTFTELDAAVRAVSEWNVKAGAVAGTDVASAVSRAATGLGIGVILAALLAAGVAVLIVRSTGAVLGDAVNQMRQGAEQVTSASGQVASASQSLSQGATEQAASLEETSASMEEMASMTRQNAESSRQAATLMQGVDERVRESNVALDAMVASMQAIKDSSDRISKIIKTIDEIAFQTNILALNAAVEAARAGSAGMGFAVVADEVRNLAQRSAQAARDTAALIEESISRSSDGAVRVEQVTVMTRGITDAVAEVKGLVDSVSLASEQQSQGIDQVSQAIAQMEKVTQTTAATAEEAAAASEELSAQAASSLEVVRRLETLVGGGAQAPAPAARPRASAGRVVPMRRPAPAPALTPEEQIPLANTGTFGEF
ncbi:MAG: methyl-accepting chemotaxis protein [Vicinamibacterales bacterium]